MRKLSDHIITKGDRDLYITVTDEKGAGGAQHRYEITGFDISTNASHTDIVGYHPYFSRLIVLFQNGTIPEKGVNGITQEALLAIVIDRLRCFQSGEFACRENAIALTKLEEALHWLHQRTINRLRRGVEGIHQK